MIRFLRGSIAVVVVAAAFAGTLVPVARAAEAADRGLLDSVVDTLVGGNPGDGFADAKQVPLRFTRTAEWMGDVLVSGGLARDSSGAIYITENHRVLKISGSAVTVIAGAASEYRDYYDNVFFAGDGDLATRAILSNPTHLAIDGSNNIYVVDRDNNRIRKISAADGKIATIAGNGDSTDGIADVNRAAVTARINGANIVGIAVNAAGDLFFADSEVNVIYKVAGADNKLTIVGGNGNAGNPPDDAVAAGSPLGDGVRGLAVNAGGDVVYTTANAIRKIKAADGKNKIIAGVIDAAAPANLLTGLPVALPDTGYPALQVNAAAIAGTMGAPSQIALDGSTIVFWDEALSNFRSFTEGGNVQTVFGSQDAVNQPGFRGDGAAAATNTPATTDDDPRARPTTTLTYDDPPIFLGNFYAGVVAAGGVVTFVDVGNNRVRQFTVGGNVASLAGCFAPFRAANAQLIPNPEMLENAAFAFSDDAPVNAKGASFYRPRNLAKDAAGNVYFDAFDTLVDMINPMTGSQPAAKVYKYDDATKTISVVAGPVIVNGFHRTPGDGGPAKGVYLVGLGAQIALDGSDTYFAETTPVAPGSSVRSRHVVRKVDATGVISTVAGIAALQGSLDPDGDPSLSTPTHTRTGKDAKKILLDTPEGVAVTATDVLIAEHGTAAAPSSWNVLKVNKATGLMTVANAGALTIQPTFLAVGRTDGGMLVGSRHSGDIVLIDGAGAATLWATLGVPTCRGMAVGGTALYVADGNGDIQKYDLNAAALAAPTLAISSPDVTEVGGIAASGTTITYASANQLWQFSDIGVGTPAVTAIAGKYFSVVGTGGVNLQVGFDFQWAAPLAMSGSEVLAGDDSDTMLRKVTPGAPAAPGAPAEATAVTVAGTGTDSRGLTGEGGPATTALLNEGYGMAVGADGALYLSDHEANTIRRVSTAGIIETFAGVPGHEGYSGDGQDRLATILGGPMALTFNAAGELVFSEDRNAIVRKVQADGNVVLVAGTPTQFGYTGDGYAGSTARFGVPFGLAFDKNGDLLIADYENMVIRVLSSTGVMGTLAGGGLSDISQTEIPTRDALLGFVRTVTIDTGGKIYASSTYEPNVISRTANGFTRAVVGTGGGMIFGPSSEGFNGDGLPGLQTMINGPESVLFVESLGLVFTDTGNNRVRRVSNLAETTNTPPEAVIVATPDRLGSAPLKVRFDGAQSVDADGDIVVYGWDFGDGSTGGGPVVEHTYAAMGAYTAALTVTDTQGQSSTARTTVFAALPMVESSTSGKGTFKVAFGPKAGTKDTFALAMKNVNGLTLQTGKAANIQIGSFSIDATVAGKGVKAKSKQAKLAIDPSRKTLALKIKGVALAAALAELGVKNENTNAPGQTVLIPVVVVVDNGALVVGDKFLFLYKGKYNKGASGKFSR